MHKIKTIALLLLCLGGNIAASADLDTGMAAYEKGDYATARREFTALADQGDAAAQYYLERFTTRDKVYLRMIKR